MTESKNEPKMKLFPPDGLPVPPEVLRQCIDRERGVSLKGISGVVFKQSNQSCLDMIPRHYERQNFGIGDECLIEIVSFIKADNQVLYDIVPQDWDCFVDEPGEVPYRRSGKRIRDVLKESNDIKYVVIYRWNFDGTPPSRDKIKDKKTCKSLGI